MACNNGDRRQWRKQETVVGAAASKMRATAKQMLGAATRIRVRRESYRFTALTAGKLPAVLLPVPFISYVFPGHPMGRGDFV